MKDPKEYIQSQIIIAGTRAPISAVRYPDDDNHTYCPFCGAQQIQELREQGVYRLLCGNGCAGYQNELDDIKKIDEINSKIASLEAEKEKVEEDIKKRALDMGTYIAAKHYVEQSEERAKFDKEILKMTK